LSTEAHEPEWSSTSRIAAGAFGLAIESDAGIPGLDAPSGATSARHTAQRLVEAEELDQYLEDGKLTSLGGSGEGALRIDYHEHSSDATLVRTTSFGDHLIAEEGHSILSSVSGANPRLWQRYVLGQVLPLAASIQGLEVFHAGAVVIEGGAVALAGGSGAGKSSVVTTLVASGAASFFSDDVLALDATAFGLTAYPGSTLMGVPRDAPVELPAALAAGPTWMADARKVLTPVHGERRPLPVRAFLRLTPDPNASQLSFEPCLPNRLMATTFDGVSRTPERLLRLLRIAARLAAGGRALELRYGPGSDPRDVADALLDRLGQESNANDHTA
jgi:hypothetical protein